MASSKPSTGSIRKGQIALVCELCENDPKLKCKCLECGLMMCQRCKDKVHPKFPSAHDHTIIDIKDVHNYQEEQKPDFAKLKCNEHVGQKCCLFCKQCDQLVCPLCIAKTHKKHDLIEIIEGYQIKVEKIKIDQDKIQESLETLSKGQNELKKIKYLEDSRYKKSKRDILDYEKVLTNAVKTHINELVNDLDQKWDKVTKSVDEEEKKVNKRKETLLQQNDEVNDILNSNDAERIFSVDYIQTNIKPVNITFSHVPQFVPGDIRNIKTIHGKLEEITTPYNTDIKIVQDFYTDLGTVSSLAVCPNGSLWIKDNMLLKILQKVTPVGDKLKIQSKFQISVEDMRLTPSGDLLLCVKGSSVVKVIPLGTDDVKNSPYNVLPLLPIGMHVTQDNKVIIGAKDARPYFPAMGPRQVILLNQSGRWEKVFQFDSHNKPLFTLPYRVTSTSNGNIGVVDVLSDHYQGRVVILNNEGGIINIYTGHPDVNTEHNPFTPLGIVTTSDNFVISDYDHHKLHILSSNGEIITYYSTEKLGIEFPMSLSFSHTGQLYIGCATYQGNDENKIYKIDNFIL